MDVPYPVGPGERCEEAFDVRVCGYGGLSSSGKGVDTRYNNGRKVKIKKAAAERIRHKNFDLGRRLRERESSLS